MEKNLNSSNWGVRLERLGYGLAKNVVDNIGRRWLLRAASFTGGPVAYFDSLGDMARWAREVEEARFMVSNPDRHALGVELGIYKRDPKSRMLPFGSPKPAPTYHADPLRKA